ncbi:MAG: endolytic transglycosylase MltG [Synergistaceae bacterium]|nr:endolytic transglycosylase MltG [Synergistaceae bacterium]MBQ3448941.1 endolytic transglycosylase MltG [Synergistaceae bacterium]MBQ3654294.1 endolytic transglycosylase MltG [Synergistaceae bacterium]MBQ3694490.1 endolytic transglycosylase MltG [Synergistaceae bacterium]MBQ9628060.1 endolytic transglycosylase MltG [Synergistaceae bacterium]
MQNKPEKITQFNSQARKKYPGHTGQTRKKKHNSLFGIILFLLIVMALCAGGYASYHLKEPREFWEGIIPIPEGDTVSVAIENGMTASQAARAFEFQGALETGSPSELSRWLVKFGIDKRIRAGHYSVVPSDPWNLARQLRTARPALLKAQILPGIDAFTLIESLESQDEKLTRKNICEALLKDSNYPPKMLEIISKLPNDEYTRAAFLMPETYMLIDRTADEVISTSASAWWRTWGEFITEHKLNANDINEAAIIASMVEREVLHDDEARTIAGVIHNRMRKNMLLQIDATVVYAWRLKGRKLTRVLNKDLEIESPYNTYKNAGLPPRPICIPGSAAWNAALDPEFNDYLYYVAGKSGYHYFAKTFNEHKKNIRDARAE